MTALSNDQRFVVLLLVALASGAWLSAGTTAQTFSQEDRGSIRKFMDVLMSFLDAESENGTSTQSPNNNATTVASTTLAGNLTTATEATTVASNSSSLATSESSTSAANATSEATTVSTTNSTTSQVSVAPRRICFKRVCYKFAGDKGYIY